MNEFDTSIYSFKYLIKIYCSTAAGIDTYSRTVLRNLNKGQKVTIWSKGSIYSDVYGLSSFKGFLYDPSHGVKIAWSVHALHPNKFSTNWSELNADPELNFNFNTMQVNLGGCWKSNSGQVCSLVQFKCN